MGHSVVVFERDPKVARYLALGLRPHFSVQVIQSREELRERLSGKHPEVMVLDLEDCQLTEIAKLHRDFPALPIICTHRIPDEEMWMAALAAGASDVCPADDVGTLLTSVLRCMSLARGTAAA
jgi:DNA-binding response OmpR family regulator